MIKSIELLKEIGEQQTMISEYGTCFLKTIEMEHELPVLRKDIDDFAFILEKGIDCGWISANLDFDKEGMLGDNIWEALVADYNEDHLTSGLTTTEFKRAFNIIKEGL